MKRLNFLAMIGLSSLISLSAAVAQAQDTFKVGMDPLFEPFSFQTPDGQLTGFDFEISTALCKAMDVTCDIKPIPYDGSIPALKSGQIDALINTYAMTKERLETFTMVGPYIRPTYRLIVSTDSSIDGTEATLSGKTIGVEKGSVGSIRYADATFAGYATMQQYDQINDAILDLDAGRVDAVFGDENQIFYAYVKKQPDRYKMVGEGVRPAEFFGEGQGFMLRKDDTVWPERLKSALEKIVANGEYETISNKYFGRNILN